MSEDENEAKTTTPQLNAGGLRWLEQIVGEPRPSSHSVIPDLPPGLDGRGQTTPRFALTEPETADNTNIPEDVTPDIDVEPLDRESKQHHNSTMVVIDLDVSVGIDDPKILEKISVTFSGLPPGASLSTGEPDKNGAWKVNATELNDLSIMITEDTGDFELLIVMDSGDNDPQSATIHVTNDPSIANDVDVFHVRLAAGEGASPIRFYVYLDGEIAYDRVIKWADKIVNFPIPMQGEGLPFEIVMRYDVIGGNKKDGPSLVGINMDGTNISSGSPAISAQGHINEHGMTWQGDLVVDVQGALRPSPTEIQDDLVDPMTTDTTRLDTDIPATPVEPEDNPMDERHENFQEVHENPTADQPEDTPEPKDDVLVVEATLDDLKSAAFIEELKRLRAFIRGHASDDDREVYKRLGVDVTKWKDMHVLGPMGGTVDLEPRLPTLAPHGGIDNTRALQRLRIPSYYSADDLEVKISGLTPGMLLTHGKNLGDGSWLLSVSDVKRASLLPEIMQTKTASVTATWTTNNGGTPKTVQQTSFLSSQILTRPTFSNTKMRMIKLPLTADVFDPKGYGALSVTIGDLPAGTILTNGKNHGGGVWTLETASGANLELSATASLPPFNITLTCVALDSSNGDSTVTSHTVTVSPEKGKMTPKTTKAA